MPENSSKSTGIFKFCVPFIISILVNFYAIKYLQ